MKKMIVGTVFLFLASLAFAQTADDYIEITRSVLKTEKKAAIAEVMELNEQEAEVFWPLYNEFNEKMYTVQTKRVKIIKDFAANYESMTDLKADELWTSSMNFKQESLNLTKQYYKKFKKILPAGKAAKYFQAENKIATLIDYQLAVEIPMLDTK
jgi:hypothetical protein